MNLREILLVSAGGAAGAVSRYLVSVSLAGVFGDRFPLGTLFVNVTGCLVLGWIMGMSDVSQSPSASTRLLIGTGFLGAFTTFSTFGVQTVQLWSKSPFSAMTNVCANLFVGIGVIWTAVGMRSALQAALGDPGAALVDTAGSVLQKLVDGGILLALTTTIVGGVGGYLMRLGKTMVVGAPLQEYYDRANRYEVRELVRATERIEARLAVLMDDAR